MRCAIFLVLAAGMALGGCDKLGMGGNGSSAAGDSEAPVKHQAGSWQSKIEIAKLEGPDVPPNAREQMQKMFDIMSSMSICMTPEAVAKENSTKKIEDLAGGRECTFDKRDVTWQTIEFSGVCNRNGQKVSMSAKGTNTATAQDITVTVHPLDAAGKANGVMEMHFTSKRLGECKPSDFTPPPEPAGAGGNAM